MNGTHRDIATRTCEYCGWTGKTTVTTINGVEANVESFTCGGCGKANSSYDPSGSKKYYKRLGMEVPRNDYDCPK